MDNSPADASVPRQCPQGHPSDTPALGIVLVLPQLAREHVCREQQDLIADVDPLLMPIARNATVLSWPARSHAPQADEAILRDANPRRDLANARRYRVAHARWLRRRQAKPLLDGPHQVRREQHGWHGIASVGSSLRIVPHRRQQLPAASIQAPRQAYGQLAAAALDTEHMSQLAPT